MNPAPPLTETPGIVLEHAMPLAFIVLAALAAVAVVLSARGVFRRDGRPGPRIAACRLAFFATLCWTLLQPAGRKRVPDANKPVFVVAVDNSASMHPSAENPAGAARWRRVRRVLDSAALRALGDDFRIEVVALADPPGAARAPDAGADFGPAEPESPLADALTAALTQKRATAPVGVLLLSDGLETRRADSSWTAGPWPCPIHVPRAEENPADFPPGTGILSLDTPRRALRGADTRLVAVVAGRAAGPVVVRLWRGDTLRDTRTVTLPEGGGRRPVTFVLPHPASGAETWTVESATQPGERDTRDNRRTVGVEVAEGGGRVTYVDGPPRWESKHLVRELREMPHVLTRALIRGPDGKFMTAGEAASAGDPLSPAALRDTRIVILGDLDAAALGPERAAALVAFVENGGGLVVLGGPAAWGGAGVGKTVLGPLLPVRMPGGLSPLSGDFPVRWTAEGLAHPAFSGDGGRAPNPPPVLTCYAGAGLAPAAVALAVAETPGGVSPLVAARRYGRGSVVAVLTDSLWRWKLHPDENRPYSRFWRRLVEWMLPEGARVAPWTVRLDPDSDEPTVRTPVAYSVSLDFPAGRPAAVTRASLRVTAPDGATRAFPLAGEAAGDTWTGRGVFTPEAPGEHRVSVELEVAGRPPLSAAQPLRVRPPAGEGESRPADVAVLRALAESSGGVYGDEAEVFAAVRARAAAGSAGTRTEYAGLWQETPVLAALILFLLAEWVLRRRRGMP